MPPTLRRFVKLVFVGLLTISTSACDRDDRDTGTSVNPSATAPTITSTSPANGATGVDVGSTVSGTFSKLIDVATVGPGALTVSVNGGTAVTGTVSLAGTVVTFTPDTDLDAATGYIATLDGSIADLSGGSLGTSMSWTFSTVGGTPPTITDVVPADSASGVLASANVVITADKPLATASVNGSSVVLLEDSIAVVAGTVSLSGAVITFDPDADLKDNTKYDLTVAGITDPSGNTLVTPFTSSFTTAAAPAGVAQLVYSSFESPDVLRATSVDNVSVSGRVLLSDSATGDFDYRGFRVSPTGTQFFLISDVGLGQDELFLIPIDGSSAPVNVSGPMVPGGNVQAAVWSPDGSRLAFVADKDFNGTEELFVVDSDGSNLLNVNPTSAGRVEEDTIAWSPDGMRLAYIADHVTPGVKEIVISEADGSNTIVVAQPGGFEPDRDHAPLWSPDGSQIAYIRRVPVISILVVNSDATNARVLDMPVGGLSIFDLEWAPDASVLVSRMNTAQPGDQLTDLYQHPLDGTSLTNLTNAPANRDVLSFRIAPDSSLILYVADTGATDNQREAFIVAPDGTGTTKITPTAFNDNDVQEGSIAWSPDSQTIIFGQDPTDSGDENLFSIRRDGTNLLQLSNLIGLDVDAAVFSPDGSQIYFADGGPGMIHVTALDGSSTVELTDEFGMTSMNPNGTNAGAFQIVDGAGVTEFFNID